MTFYKRIDQNTRQLFSILGTPNQSIILLYFWNENFLISNLIHIAHFMRKKMNTPWLCKLFVLKTCPENFLLIILLNYTNEKLHFPIQKPQKVNIMPENFHPVNSPMFFKNVLSFTSIKCIFVGGLVVSRTLRYYSLDRISGNQL